mmetsp:Transcript_68216/g.134786  ORF Transcript_68216/g.134786 Transcript_68216/m.134786 type:complete len:369 (-) Transcript_68216:25-1131(-)
MAAASGSTANSFLAASPTPVPTVAVDAQEEDDQSSGPPRFPWRIVATLGVALVAGVGLAAVAWCHSSSGTFAIDLSGSLASSSSGSADLISLVQPPSFAGAWMPCSNVMPCWAGCICAPSKKHPAKNICQPVDGVKDCKYGVKPAYLHLDKAKQNLKAIKAKAGKTSNHKSSTEKMWKAAAKKKQETAAKAKKLHERYTRVAKISSIKGVMKEHKAQVARAERVLKQRLALLHQAEHRIMNKAAGEIDDAEKHIVYKRKVVLQTNASELKKMDFKVGVAQQKVKASENRERKIEHLALSPIIQAKHKLWKAEFTKTRAANDRIIRVTNDMIRAEHHRNKMAKNDEEAAKRLAKEDTKVNKWLDALRIQ